MIGSPLPKRLKQARIAAGMSQKKLGIAAGIDEFAASPRINQYETGKHTPDYLTLNKIARVLAVPIAYFYAETDALAQAITLFSQIREPRRSYFLTEMADDIKEEKKDE